MGVNFNYTVSLAGCDFFFTCNCACAMIFQSTHPLRGATQSGKDQDSIIFISIHAPLAGCDIRIRTKRCKGCYFNPRTPCGVRLNSGIGQIRTEIFQSTHPLRGATTAQRRKPQRFQRYFNPRTPCGVRHAGNFALAHADHGHFNPRTPCGVRLDAYDVIEYIGNISIHTPQVGRDRIL